MSVVVLIISFLNVGLILGTMILRPWLLGCGVRVVLVICDALSPLLGKLVQKHVAVVLRRPSLFVLKEAQNVPGASGCAVGPRGDY